MPPVIDDTEKSIISSIPDFEDNDTDTSDGTTTPATETATDNTAVTAPNNGVAEADSGGSKPDALTQPAPVIRKDGFVEKPNPEHPNTRDLVDPATGQVVARGGVERRIFESAQRLHRENSSLTTRLQQAEAQNNSATEIVKLGTTLGLSAPDQQASFNLMSQFLKDPVRMLEQLVIEVKSKGYEIPFLATGITPGMDTAAVQRMIDSRMSPITNATKQQEQQTQIQAQAKEKLDVFLDENPEGTHNLGVLAEMMTAQPGMTIENAYTRLVKWCVSNGYDYTQPLKPQIAAKQQPATNTAQTPELPRNSVPLPNGRQANGAAQIEQVASFDENSSWADIIRHSMRATG